MVKAVHCKSTYQVSIILVWAFPNVCCEGWAFEEATILKELSFFCHLLQVVLENSLIKISVQGWRKVLQKRRTTSHLQCKGCWWWDVYTQQSLHKCGLDHVNPSHMFVPGLGMRQMCIGHRSLMGQFSFWTLSVFEMKLYTVHLFEMTYTLYIDFHLFEMTYTLYIDLYNTTRLVHLFIDFYTLSKFVLGEKAKVFLSLIWISVMS